jgi:inhibitor of cysteine peptidase
LNLRIGAILLAAAAFAVTATPLRAVDGRRLSVGEGYDGGVVTLAVGDSLAVKLPAPNAGTWTVAFADPSVLKLAGSDPSEPGSSTQVLRFDAAETGTTGLGLAYRPAAKKSSPPEKLYRLQVVVRTDAGPRTLELSPPDDGSRISVTQGDRIVVKLPANVTTGYSWSIAENDPSILLPAGSARYEPPSRPEPGAPGVQIFELRVLGGGTAWLQLVYRRPFEKDVPPARTWNAFVSSASVEPR